MILVAILIILLAGGLLSWITARWHATASRWIALVAVVTGFGMMLAFWISHGHGSVLKTQGAWMAGVHAPWIPGLGIGFHLGLDGLSLIMTLLTLLLGALAILASWRTEQKNTGFYFFNILWLLAGILGVFFSLDLILFYFFWELMLVPMYFILILWGHEKRQYAGMKFFLFTQLSGLLMLVAILGLYFIHGRSTGVYTFDYEALLGTPVSAKAGFWLMLGFLAAFLVKLPVVPFHSWLPDAYTQAPVSGTMILAALMSKTGAYGILRFVLPLFPDAAQSFGFTGVLLGVIGILYGAKMAYAQTDLKRMIAFSSVSHMGFIMVGIFSFQALAYQGVLMQMVAHALSIAGLFFIAEIIYERTATFDMDRMGRFWERMPRMGGMTLVFVMASLGLPGLANFIAEFLVLAGAWQTQLILCVLASLGLVVSAVYSLVIFQKVFHERKSDDWTIRDCAPRELAVMGILILAIVWLGFFPQPVMHAVQPAIDHLMLTIQGGLK